MGYDFEDQVDQYFENLEAYSETIGIIVIAIILACMLLALAGWIMRSIALTHLGNRRGVKAAWLVWLPIVGPWTIGALADDYDARNGIKRRFRAILLVCSILVTAIYSSSYGSLISEPMELASEIEYGITPEMTGDLLKAILILYAGAIACSLVYVVQYVITYICLYKVYESTLPRHAVLCFILSLLVPMAEPICLLIAMNKGYPDETPALPCASEAAPEARGWYEA